jgi:hypothetical protein
MATAPAPITVPAAITDLKLQITNIRKKNNVLIGYYIEPKPVPSELLAHDPRLGILTTRLDTLAKLSMPTTGKTGNLAFIMDEPDAIAAEYLNEIIDQLLNAIHGFQEIFEQRYDPELKVKKPFDTIYKTIEYRETQLKNVIFDARRPPLGMHEPLRPEDMSPSEPVYFCRGAVQMINNRDKGRISAVLPSELLRENRTVLSKYGGAFLWWQCPSCEFRARFHIAGSSSSSIHNTEEIREHPDCDVEYRSIFLAKSHLFNDPSFAGEQIINRRPRSISGRNSISFASDSKYGCLFCFGQGKELSWANETMFRTGQDLAEHIAENHRKGKKIPPPLMLRKFCVAIDGRHSDGVRRWELNFK